MDAEFIMMGMEVNFTWRNKILELVVPLAMSASIIYFAIGNVYSSGNAIKILQIICFCVQMSFLTAVANLGYICCAALGLRFACISKELKVIILLYLQICEYFYDFQNIARNSQVKCDQAWVVCKRKRSQFSTLKSCFVKLANASARLNKTMEIFWLLDVLQLTVNTITALGRIITADTEQQKGKNWNQFLVATLSITRLLLLSFICGDTSDKVRLPYFALQSLYFAISQATGVAESLAAALHSTADAEEKTEVCVT